MWNGIIGSIGLKRLKLAVVHSNQIHKKNKTKIPKISSETSRFKMNEKPDYQIDF